MLSAVSAARANAVSVQDQFTRQPVFGSASGGLETLKSKAAFEEAIASSTLPLLVKFEKPHCPACEEAEPVVNAVAKSNDGKLNVVKALMWDEANPDNRSMKRLAFDYKLKTVPVFILFEKGNEVARAEGKDGLIKLLDEQGYAHGEDVFQSALPKPYQPPNAALTVLFDGECPICRASAEKLKTLDENDRLALIPLQSDLVREKYPDLNPEDLRTSIHIVRESDGKVFKGADAFAEMGAVIKSHSGLGRLLKLFTVAAHVPGFLPVADRLYLAFSKRRFMIKVKQAGCKECELTD